jgi:hypothetical protein
MEENKEKENKLTNISIKPASLKGIGVCHIKEHLDRMEEEK